MSSMNGASGSNGAQAALETAESAAAAGEEGAPRGPDPEVQKKVAALRAHVRESFGQIAMSMMMLPRYRHQSLGDLQHLILEPLIRDRIAIAWPGNRHEDPLVDSIGVAIWASVSDEADTRIREQIRSGVFPVRLKAEDWNSGSHHWLLDVIAPDAKTTANVIANFKQVVKDGSLRLHPIITKLVDAEMLMKRGAVQTEREEEGGSEVGDPKK